MKTIMDELKEVLSQPGWNDQVAEEFERVQILDEGAADMGENVDTCMHLHLLSILCRKGRKVGFSDQDGEIRLSTRAAVLAFKRCIEICERLHRDGETDVKIMDQLNRSYYGIADLLLKESNRQQDSEKQLVLLKESRLYANLQRDLLQKAVAAGESEYNRDFAGQFVALSEMLLEMINDNIREIEG